VPTWRRWLVPAVRSERHAIRALEVGFVLEAATEVYQWLTSTRPVGASSIGYYLGLGATLLGFYFLWRGLHEWNRLSPARTRGGPRRLPWESLALLLGGTGAVAALNVALRNVGAGDSPAPLDWLVGGAMVLAVGSFFLNLRRMVARRQTTVGQGIGWAAFVWSLGISAVSGLVLGQAIVGLFVDFFTSWPALFLALAPFIVAISPLFVAFALIALAFADAYRSSPDGRPNE